MRRIKILFCDLYILAWCVYLLQMNLGIRGEISGNLFLALVLVSLVAFLFVLMKKKKSPYLKGMTLFFSLVLLYGGLRLLFKTKIYGLEDEVVPYTYLQMYFRSLLPFFTFYYLLTKIEISQKDVIRYFLYFFICYILNLCYSVFMSVWAVSELNKTYNVGFRFVGLLPMIYLLGLSKTNKILLSLFVFIFIVMSSKRGAMFAGGITLVLLFYRQIRHIPRRYYVYVFLLIVLLLCVAGYYVQEIYDQSPALQAKIEKTLEGDSSGRDEMYADYITFFLDNYNIVGWFLGEGADSTIEHFGQYAHNDWIEILLNQGLLGISLYTLYWFFFYKECRLYGMSSELFNSITSIFIIYLLISLYSMSINDMPHCATFSLAYIISHRERVSIISKVIK